MDREDRIAPPPPYHAETIRKLESDLAEIRLRHQQLFDRLRHARRDTLAHVAAWHREQGRIFADTATKLEHDRASEADIQRAKWAAASHHAHAAHIARMQIEEPPLD